MAGIEPEERTNQRPVSRAPPSSTVRPSSKVMIYFDDLQCTSALIDH